MYIWHGTCNFTYNPRFPPLVSRVRAFDLQLYRCTRYRPVSWHTLCSICVLCALYLVRLRSLSRSPAFIANVWFCVDAGILASSRNSIRTGWTLMQVRVAALPLSFGCRCHCCAAAAAVLPLSFCCCCCRRRRCHSTAVVALLRLLMCCAAISCCHINSLFM